MVLESKCHQLERANPVLSGNGTRAGNDLRCHMSSLVARVMGLARLTAAGLLLVGCGTLDQVTGLLHRWTTKASMPTERGLLGVAAINGILYAVGGLNRNGILATVEAYDPVTNTWTAKASMLDASRGVGVAAI